MKKIAVFFDAPRYDDYPFNDNVYREAYHDLAVLIQKEGGEFYVARTQESFLGNNTFSHGWRFENNTFVPYDKQFTVDVVYDKGHFKPDSSTKLSNDRELDDVCIDKLKTAQWFPEASPRTVLVRNAQELEDAIVSISGEKIVAKPQDGEEGKGVVIGSADEVRAAVTSYPYIIQEFLDFSDGIPGIVEGPHDFRIIVINGELGTCYVRTPPPGQLRANFAQGGTYFYVEPERIPKEAMDVMKAVDTTMSRFVPRVYSVDMGRTKDGSWKIIELNSRVAISPRSECQFYPRYLDLLAHALLSAA